MTVSQFYSVDKQKRENSLMLPTEGERKQAYIATCTFFFVVIIITESTTSMSLEGERMVYDGATLS